MKLKLDLHTHCLEAVNFARPEPKTVKRIIEAVQAGGLDGIAITDHDEMGDGFAYAVREIVERHFPGEILVIPGRELRWCTHHIVELDLPAGLTFRFLAHPGRDLSVWDDPGAPTHGSSGGVLRPEGPEDPVSRATPLPPGESGGETPLADVASLVFRFRSMVREETQGLCSLGRGELPMGLLRELHGLEVENGNQTIDRAGVMAFARHRGLLLLSNSDAHSLSDIGSHYTETSLEELCAHAR